VGTRWRRRIETGKLESHGCGVRTRPAAHTGHSGPGSPPTMLVLRPIPLARRSLLRALQSTRPPHISLFYHSRNFGIRMGGGTHTVDTAARLAALRALMRARAPPVGAYVVPSEDARAYLYASERLGGAEEREQTRASTSRRATSAARGSRASTAPPVRSSSAPAHAKARALMQMARRLRGRHRGRRVPLHGRPLLPPGGAAARPVRPADVGGTRAY
jgi:hypothetical protein